MKRMIWSAVRLALVLAAHGEQATAGAFHIAASGLPQRIGDSALTVTPSQDWNRLGRRVGHDAESWSEDGLSLNDVTFYAGVPSEQTLLKARSPKDKPLPPFSATMLPPDVAQMFEETYRIANDTSIFTVDKIEPAKFLGGDGFRFFYTFVSKDEVERKGMATAAVRDGKLYMITLEAPTIHYFDTTLPAYQQLVESATLGAGAKPKR